MAVLLAACGIGAPAVATADQSVVTATIYSGQAGGTHTASASLSTLSGCQQYDGGSPLSLYPGGGQAAQPYQPPAGSTWTVATILTCGLQIPLANVDSVQIDSPTRGYETPLSASALSDPSDYDDPTASGALPIVSNDGGEDQNTYVRPWRGGSDANAADQVTNSSGPITVVVNENGSPLVVRISQHPFARTHAGEQVRLGATVTTADGVAVPAGQLTWSWSFGDGSAPSAAATPSHGFVPGSTIVTALVSDVSTGRGGTATVDVVYDAVSAGTGPGRRGAGAKHTGTPTGPRHGGDAHTGTHGTGTTTGGSTTTTPTTSTTTTTTPTTPATSAIPPSTTPTTTTLVTPRPPHRRIRSSPPITAPGQLVTGRLIADVVTLPPAASPLVHVAPGTAIAVRSGRVPAPTGAIVAGLAILALLGLGARRERGGRLVRSLHR